LNPYQEQKSKLFIQNVLIKLSSNSALNDSRDQCTLTKHSGRSSIYSTASLDNFAENVDDNSSTDLKTGSTNALALAKRPSNLPPKSEEEERRHQTEFNEILRQAKKRELKALKLKKRTLLKQFRQEDEIRGAIRAWTNDILPSWPLSITNKRTRELWWNGIPSPIRPKVWSLAIGNDLRITDELFRICVERSKERIWTKQFLCRRSSNPYPSTFANSVAKQHRRVSSQPVDNKLTTSKDSLPVEELTTTLRKASIQEGIVECAKALSDSEDDEDKSESIAYLIKLDVSRTFPHLGLFQEGSPYHQSLSDVLAAYAVYRPDLG